MRPMETISVACFESSLRSNDVGRCSKQTSWRIQRCTHGSDVLVHCRGGLGRAGTIASRLLIELGMVPETAIARVRAFQPGAIEKLCSGRVRPKRMFRIR